MKVTTDLIVMESGDELVIMILNFRNTYPLILTLPSTRKISNFGL